MKSKCDGEFCSKQCRFMYKLRPGCRDEMQQCMYWKETLTYSYKENKYRRCELCMRYINGNKNGFLKEPVRDPTDRGKPLYGPPNKKVSDDVEGWERSTEDMYHDESIDSVSALCVPMLIVGVLLMGIGLSTTVAWVAITGATISILGAALGILDIDVIDIVKNIFKCSTTHYTKQSQPILDNLTQIEAALCTKISKLPNKNKLIKQCKEYAQTLMNSKTDQSIEPLLTKLYNICADQLNVGLKENVREIECFISAVEEVESRSLNNEEN